MALQRWVDWAGLEPSPHRTQIRWCQPPWPLDQRVLYISPMQHAYSGSKGTDTALSTLVSMIESSILRGKCCLVISVDIKGAFDNLSNLAIENALRAANYPPIMIRWYMNFLKSRESIADVLGVKSIILPACGTPQGGVLSSRVWNLAFDPLIKLLNANSPCSPVGFADDGALMPQTNEWWAIS